jgi:hypothetical protein
MYYCIVCLFLIKDAFPLANTIIMIVSQFHLYRFLTCCLDSSVNVCSLSWKSFLSNIHWGSTSAHQSGIYTVVVCNQSLGIQRTKGFLHVG